MLRRTIELISTGPTGRAGRVIDIDPVAGVDRVVRVRARRISVRLGCDRACYFDFFGAFTHTSENCIGMAQIVSPRPLKSNFEAPKGPKKSAIGAISVPRLQGRRTFKTGAFT
jgi:hypothetical protein